MPPTNRKSLYPESSVPYTIYIKPTETIAPSTSNEADLKLDPRPTFLKVGILSQVKGSAYLEYGNTKLLAAILPPREISKQSKKNALGVIQCDFKYAPFATNDRTENLTKKEQFLSVALKKALEPVICLHEFPNFQIDIMVYILQDDGCALSSAINCCGAALAEGGIPIYDVITASTVCIYGQHVFINPTAAEEEIVQMREEKTEITEQGLCVIASLAAVDQVAECFQKGYMTYETIKNLTNYALKVNQSLLSTVKHVLVDKVKHHLK
ncbi:exosome complex component MTR3 [Episyrphus balteatus]|uniref:exosome complex component MTR3 n=1 Tax=Episyrphus balteatus TaxID=286459 RepID=UPI0024863CF4|nr:exosome complex component MTR3 [Episyrphus balteatus]